VRLIALRILGAEVFAIEWGHPPAEDLSRDLSGGTTGSMPISFTPQHGDQRWQPGGEP